MKLLWMRENLAFLSLIFETRLFKICETKAVDLELTLGTN